MPEQPEKVPPIPSSPPHDTQPGFDPSASAPTPTPAPGQPMPAERLPDTLPESPLPLLKMWFDEAVAAGILPNPNAMTLATADADGRPSARIVLCKSIDVQDGFVLWYTNYQSAKASSLQSHPSAALVMHWDVLERQVRIAGPVVKSPPEESDAYFASRAWPSRIGAWASDQSQPVASRSEMIEKVAQTMRRFGLDPANPPPDDAKVEVPRPPHWGGYRVFIERIEFWMGGAGRVHDRGVWARELTADGPHMFRSGAWRAGRLQP